MILLPLLALQWRHGGWIHNRVMHPAMPIGRHLRTFCQSAINNVAALAAFKARLALFVIAIALLVRADQLSAPADVEQSP